MDSEHDSDRIIMFLVILFVGVQTSNGLPAAGNYAVVNVDRNGYYRVHYDDEARGLILADLDTGNSVRTAEWQHSFVDKAQH